MDERYKLGEVHIGLNVDLARIVVFAVGSALAGLAGFLSAVDIGIDPHVGFGMLLFAIAACIFGGIGNFIAPFLGAIIIGLLQVSVGWYGSIRWQSAVTFALLILLLLAKPEGLFGNVKRVEEL